MKSAVRCYYCRIKREFLSPNSVCFKAPFKVHYFSIVKPPNHRPTIAEFKEKDPIGK